MPILLKMNLKCNFRCKYCYQRAIRPEEEIINHKAVEETILRLWEQGGGKDPKTGKPKLNDKGQYCGPQITLHGGEPTVLPIEDFERYLKLSHRLTGCSGIQTNGYNITDAMIQMFKKYHTHVGISIDGPYPLSENRGNGTPELRKKMVAKIFKNMDKLRKEKISLSVIAVIHKQNALGERREILKKWVKELDSKGITGRLNPCCSGIDEIDLTPDEAIEAYTDLYNFMLEEGLSQWSPFKDIINSFKGESEVVCSFRGCDPYCTSSAITVLNDGTIGVCLRLYGDGKKYLRAITTSSLRQEVLYKNDCAGCEWWQHCYGGCSGLSVDWDWRNKDRYCELYKVLFEKTDNMFKALRIQKPRQAPSPSSSGIPTGGFGQHNDGVEHLDGDTRHLDSDNHTDSDNTTGDHTDGIEHQDGVLKHLDSG